LILVLYTTFEKKFILELKFLVTQYFQCFVSFIYFIILIVIIFQNIGSPLLFQMQQIVQYKCFMHSSCTIICSCPYSIWIISMWKKGVIAHNLITFPWFFPTLRFKEEIRKNFSPQVVQRNFWSLLCAKMGSKTQFRKKASQFC